jgi:aryl-alcohol dehydrogenase-like predicted oxidoreductase
MAAVASAAIMSAAKPPLSRVMPPLIVGCAGFSKQFHFDPLNMPYVEIVRRAIELDIAAFDTSPYYGPSEILLGESLKTLNPPRDKCFLITKVGRIAGEEFDYTPSWVRYSVYRSLERLGTPYLDLVYTHDAEFVSPAEVLAAVRELRRLRDEGVIRYVGISGYPVEVLASLAEMILRETGEPLDAVMSYSHLCVQNMQLARPDLLKRFEAAQVDCIPTASILSMALLTTRGVNAGPQNTWHPAPEALRKACHDLVPLVEAEGKRMEDICVRWAVQTWGRIGAPFGSHAYNLLGGTLPSPQRLGIVVMGMASVDDLEDNYTMWKSVAAGIAGIDHASVEQAREVRELVEEKLIPSLGEWKDYTWDSPGKDYVNRRLVPGQIPIDDIAIRNGLVQLPLEAMERPKI